MVLLFEVENAQQKKECIVGLAYQYFLLNQKLQFIVDDENAGKFLDQLLWSFPMNSFLPHVFNTQPKHEKIAVMVGSSWKEATVTFNLQSLKTAEGTIIIELLDKSDPIKEQRTRDKLSQYIQNGRPVSCHHWGRQILTPNDLLPRQEAPKG